MKTGNGHIMFVDILWACSAGSTKTVLGYCGWVCTQPAPFSTNTDMTAWFLLCLSCSYRKPHKAAIASISLPVWGCVAVFVICINFFSICRNLCILHEWWYCAVLCRLETPFVLTACNVTCFVDPFLRIPHVIACSLLRNPGISASTLASARLWRSPLPCWNCSLPWAFLLSSWTLLSILYLLPSCSLPPRWNLQKTNLLRYDVIDTRELTLFSAFTVAYPSEICLLCCSLWCVSVIPTCVPFASLWWNSWKPCWRIRQLR